MLNVLSIGITETLAKNSCLCAYDDAIRIYSFFAENCASFFSGHNSICVKNISTTAFDSFVYTIKHSVQKEDIFVIYFSGHGTTKNDKLYLCFEDKDYSMESIKETLDECDCHVLLILDCCNASGALSLANRKGYLNTTRISVLASTHFYSSSSYDANGSEFTRYLLMSLRHQYVHHNLLSLNSVFNTIIEQGYTQCEINIEEGQSDLILWNGGQDEFAPILANQFVKKLNTSNYELRETLLYTLQDYSYPILFEAIKKYVEERSELSWIVRRVIGSQLSHIIDDKDVFDYCLNQLCYNNDWTVKIVCAIALRYKAAEDKSVRDIFSKILLDKSSSVDLVWILALYLTESPDESLVQSLSQSMLMRTDWGKIEIIKMLHQNEKKRATEFIHSLFDGDSSPTIKAYLSLIDDNNPMPKELQPVLSTELAKKLLVSKNRGRLSQNTHHKQLLSAIFGNYRYSIIIDFDNYFNSFSKMRIREELQMARDFPLVEMKMALFGYFQANPTLLAQYKDVLTWGLKDDHPWVRREALKACAPRYKHICIENLRTEKIDCYPGYFDLLCEMVKSGYPITLSQIEDSISVREQDSIILEMSACGEFDSNMK